MSIPIKAGTADVSVILRFLDSTDGTPELGVSAATTGLVVEYRRELGSETAITPSNGVAVNSAHSDGAFIHIGDGYYRLDVPDAAFASSAGVRGVLVHGVATGMVAQGEYVVLTGYDPYDSVRAGLTALPNAAADAAGGLPISDAGGLDLDAQIGADIDAILVDTGTTLDGRIPAALVGGRMDASVGAMAANVLTATAINADAITAAKVAADVSAEIADAVWDEDATAHQTGGTFGQAIGDPGADTTTIYQSVVTDAAGTNIAADIIAIEAQTDDIGAAGAGLTAVPWNAAWDAEVQSEVADALDAAIPAVNTAGSVNDVLLDRLDARLIGTIAAGTHNAQSGDSFARLGAPAGASVSADIAAVKTDTAAILVDTGTTLDGRIPAALVGGRMDSNVSALNNVATGAARIARSTQGIVLGTVGTSSSITSLVTSSLDPAASVTDQFKGRIVTFEQGTATAALRGQSTDITASTVGGVLTVTALTTAPASGDVFIIT